MLWPAKPEKKEPPTTAIGVNLYRYLNSPTKQIQRRHSNIIIVDQISFKSSIKAYPCKVWYMHGMVPHKVLSSVSCIDFYASLNCSHDCQFHEHQQAQQTSTLAILQIHIQKIGGVGGWRVWKRDPGWQNSTQVCQKQNQAPVDINIWEWSRLSFHCSPAVQCKPQEDWEAWGTEMFWFIKEHRTPNTVKANYMKNIKERSSFQSMSHYT